MIQRILIRNARILKTRKASLTPSCDLLIEDNRIKTMLPSEAAQTLRQWFENLPADAAKQIEASQGVLMPGLIDCHVHVLASQMHLGQLGRLPNVLAVLRAVPILEGMIRRGFTTVRDAGGADDALRQATADGTILGPRIFPSGRALSQTGGHGDMRERNDIIEPCACTLKVGAIARIVDGVDAMRKAVREEIQRGATQIKIMASGGVASPNDPIHVLGYSEDEIRAAVEEADNASSYVMAHAYTARAIKRAIRCGVRSIEHGNLVDDEAATMMADKGAFAVPTLVTYDALAQEGKALGLPLESLTKIESVRGHGLRSLEIFAKAGVSMAYGSDLLGPTQRLQSEEFRLRASVLGPAAAVKAATCEAAKLLQREHELGDVFEGAIADLILLRGNPLEDINILCGQGEGIQWIMKDGILLKGSAP